MEEWVKKYWIYVVLGIFAINFLILYFLIFLPKPSPQIAPIQNSCPQSCLDQINLAATSKNVSPTPLTAKPTITLSPSSLLTPTASPTPSQLVREFFIPLGTGTGSSGDWTVIDGMGAKIDPANYGNIKQITFEVTAWIPTGNEMIWIRLYNATTLQPVVNSEVTSSGGTPVLLVSSPINLTSGNNLYQIQMKTQLKYPVNVDMARLRIDTD